LSDHYDFATLRDAAHISATNPFLIQEATMKVFISNPTVSLSTVEIAAPRYSGK